MTDALGLAALLTHLELKTFQTLFKLHQTLRQGIEHLGDIFRRASDAKGHGLSHPKTGECCPDDNTWVTKSQELSDHAIRPGLKLEISCLRVPCLL